jgi:hypothetical protein
MQPTVGENAGALPEVVAQCRGVQVLACCTTWKVTLRLATRVAVLLSIGLRTDVRRWRVSGVVDSLAVGGDGVEDLVSGLRPHERAGVIVPGVDP